MQCVYDGSRQGQPPSNTFVARLTYILGGGLDIDCSEHFDDCTQDEVPDRVREEG